MNREFKWFFAVSLTAFVISSCAVDQSYAPAKTKTYKKTKTYTYSYPCPDNAIAPKPYQVFGQWYQPLACARGFRQRGIASWYGPDFHGKKTSSGEVYDMYSVSAAHKTLPLGTYVRVYNVENGRTIDVIINDRGPFIPGRIIDLSYEAGKRLGIIGPGTSPVEIIVLSEPAPVWKQSASTVKKSDSIPNTFTNLNYTVQIGAFTDYQKARSLATELNPLYSNANVRPYQRGSELLYRVTVGKCTTLEKAGEYESRLKQQGFYDAFVIAE